MKFTMIRSMKKRRMAFALEIQQHHDQQRDDADVVPAVLDRVPNAPQFRAWNACEVVAGRLIVHLHQKADIIERGRDNRPQSHFRLASLLAPGYY